MKRAILCALLAVAAIADQPPVPRKPACKAATQGRFWPEEANTDPKAARRLAQCGTLEICSVAVFRYKWKPVTVNVRQLGKGRGASPGCASNLQP